LTGSKEGDEGEDNGSSCQDDFLGEKEGCCCADGAKPRCGVEGNPESAPFGGAFLRR